MWRRRKKKVGLALGGGAARGMAHVGVLKVLQQEGIPIDIVVGTSAGAIIGALLAQGKDATQIEELILDISSRKWTQLLDPAIPRTGLIRGNKIKALLASFFGGDIKFSDLKIPFACVAADINTGEEVVLNSGSVLEAVRASISIPGIFTLVRVKGRYLVDGDIVNPVPVSVLRQMGVEFVIGVNVVPRVSELIQGDNGGSSKEPNIVHVLLQSMYIGTYALVRESLEDADIIIEPDVAHINAADLHRASECIHQGEVATRSAIADIKRLLKSL